MMTATSSKARYKQPRMSTISTPEVSATDSNTVRPFSIFSTLRRLRTNNLADYSKTRSKCKNFVYRLGESLKSV
jgi:hypothetical protein